MSRRDSRSLCPCSSALELTAWLNEPYDELPELARRSTRESLVRDNFSRMQLHREYGNAGITTTLAAWDTESQHYIDLAFTCTDIATVDVPRSQSKVTAMSPCCMTKAG